MSKLAHIKIYSFKIIYQYCILRAQMPIPARATSRAILFDVRAKYCVSNTFLFVILVRLMVSRASKFGKKNESFININLMRLEQMVAEA